MFRVNYIVSYTLKIVMLFIIIRYNTIRMIHSILNFRLEARIENVYVLVSIENGPTKSVQVLLDTYVKGRPLVRNYSNK